MSLYARGKLKGNGKKRALRQLRLLTPFATVAATTTGACRCRRAKIRIQKRPKQQQSNISRRRQRPMSRTPSSAAYCIVRERSHSLSSSICARRSAASMKLIHAHTDAGTHAVSMPVYQYEKLYAVVVVALDWSRRRQTTLRRNTYAKIMALRKSRLYEKENLGKSAKRVSGAKTQKNKRYLIKKRRGEDRDCA